PDEPGSTGLLRHGKDRRRRFLSCTWDRLNGETVFMYVLAAGAAAERAIAGDCCTRLGAFKGTVANLTFNNADLGLFVFQYGLDLLDLRAWQAPAACDLAMEAAVATLANHRVCRDLAGRFRTYRDYWGLSAGDGPGQPPADHSYREYSPSGPIDGTAHLTAALASVAHAPDLVLDALRRAHADRRLAPLGRYGFSSVNLDRGWAGPWMIGIDAGAAVLALENYLAEGHVRRVMHRLPGVQRGLERLGLRQADPVPPQAIPAKRLAS